MPADTVERLYTITRRRAVTPGDTDLALDGVYPRALMVDVGGTVTGVTSEDTDSIAQTFAAGIWHPVSFKFITAAGATGLVAGY